MCQSKVKTKQKKTKKQQKYTEGQKEGSEEEKEKPSQSAWLDMTKPCFNSDEVRVLNS